MNSANLIEAKLSSLHLDIEYGVRALILPTLACCLIVVGLLAVLIVKSRPRVGIGPSVIFVTSFAMIGAVAGVIAGATMESIVGAVLAAILGLISSLLTYLFGKTTLRLWRPIIPLAIIALLMATLGGLVVGGSRRNQIMNDDVLEAKDKFEFENRSIPVERAHLLELTKRCVDESVDVNSAITNCSDLEERVDEAAGRPDADLP